jgi:hypothetical protein
MISLEEHDSKPPVMGHDRSIVSVVDGNLIAVQYLLRKIVCSLIVPIFVSWLQRQGSTVLHYPALVRGSSYDIIREAHDRSVCILRLEENWSIVAYMP